MALYRENPPNVFRLWTGEKIGGISHPPEIETAWPVEELEALKLFIPAAAEPVPEGKVSTGVSVKRVDGVVRFAHDLIDEPPPGVPDAISPLQARRALRAAGLKSWVDAYVATLSEEEQEAWEYAVEVRRNNAIIAAGAAVMGMTEQQIDNLFILGVTL